MKLRNKKTGEIAEPFGITCVNGRAFVQFEDEKGTFKFEARSLAELNEEWEDAPEEPKGYWYIDWNGEVCRSNIHDERTEQMKKIGNYFETEEEAEKAMEKLRAWKRLKDKGFRFTVYDDYHIDYGLTGKCAWTDETVADLNLLFGGEE